MFLVLVAACGKVRDLGTMDGAVLVAFVASIGNMLQGWDNASIAGEEQPVYFIVFTSLVDHPID